MSAPRRFTGPQCRAARALLDWSQDRLAAAAGLESEAIELFERGEGVLSGREAVQLARALADVVPIEPSLAGEGVRLRHHDLERWP